MSKSSKHVHAEFSVPVPPCRLFDVLADSAYIRAANLVQSRDIHHASGPLPFSMATLWRMVAAGTFPKPIKLSERMTAWRVGDVRLWLHNRANGPQLNT